MIKISDTINKPTLQPFIRGVSVNGTFIDTLSGKDDVTVSIASTRSAVVDVEDMRVYDGGTIEEEIKPGYRKAISCIEAGQNINFQKVVPTTEHRIDTEEVILNVPDMRVYDASANIINTIRAGDNVTATTSGTAIFIGADDMRVYCGSAVKNIKAGDNITLTNDGGELTIKSAMPTDVNGNQVNVLAATGLLATELSGGTLNIGGIEAMTEVVDWATVL